MGVVELPNICDDPYNGFELSFENQDKLDDPNTLGTFHTHPSREANLSVDDYESFLAYPRLTHYIIGSDGVRSYKFINGVFVNAG